jgi:UDP-4-amino-4-deoxy-L-arabinose-oxoglutarate aminotransferase
MSKFIPYTKPSISDDDIHSVVESLRSSWIKSGPVVSSFESSFTDWIGGAYSITFNSATAGFDILLKTLGIKKGKEIITPSLTWPSFVGLLCLSGITPVFVDINPDTFQLDVTQVEQLITPRTVGIVPLHYAGQCYDIEPLQEICKTYGLYLIEDAAHAIGSEYQSIKVGNHGNISIFSMNAIKNITSGEGGIITTPDSLLSHKLKRARSQGIDRDSFKCHGVRASRYDVKAPGWNATLTDFQAALASSQLKRIDILQKSREKIAKIYLSYLPDIPGITIQKAEAFNTRNSWHIFPVLIDTNYFKFTRDQFREELMNKNIGTGLHFIPVHLLTYYKSKLCLKTNHLKHTEEIGDRIISLPLFPDMSIQDAYYVIDAIESIAKGKKQTIFDLNAKEF